MPGYLFALAYCVIHVSALYVFLTLVLATNGLEFFYFYPREVQTVLQPFSLQAEVWLGAGVFSVLGLTLFGFRTRDTREFAIRSALALIALILLVVSFLMGPVQFWWMGTIAVAICWLRLGPLTRIVGGQRQLLLSFLASLLAIGAIVEIWSLGHWFCAAVDPSTTWGKAGADFEMNLTYATFSLFPAIFVAAWLSPIWIPVLLLMFRKLQGSGPRPPRVAGNPRTRQLKLGLDDAILALAIMLVSVLVGFYAYFHDPPWLVGTDAYWGYYVRLERIADSGNALSAAANEVHGFYLLLLYGVHTVTGISTFNIIKASPVVLCALLSVSSYFLVAGSRGKRIEGFLAGFLSATTFPTTLGIFASILAMWLALSLALITFWALVSSDLSSRNRMPKIVLAAFCGTLLLITHAWVWGVTMASILLAAFVFVSSRNRRMSVACTVVLLSSLLSGGLIFVSTQAERALEFGRAITDFMAPLANQSSLLSPFGIIRHELGVWAPFLNPILMVLAAAGVLCLVLERPSAYKILLLCWMAVAGTGTFFAVGFEGGIWIWRMWYLQPLWLLAATGINGLLQTGDSNNDRVALAPEGAKIDWRSTATVLVGGLVVVVFQLVAGASAFYVGAVSPLLLGVGRRRANAQTIFASILILFLCLFFLNQALRSLFPLILYPHNYLEHP